MVIAIDGPAGSGKSSTAKGVAGELHIAYLDTGAMYRAITLKCLRKGIKHTNVEQLKGCVETTSIVLKGFFPKMQVIMDGEDVSLEIRSDEVTKNVSDYCAPAVVRRELVRQQRILGSSGNLVCDGRDIGTVVFPNAELKFFMVASVEERAARRQRDFRAMGVEKSVEELIKDIQQRDFKDSNRSNSPLVKASDAEEIDTTFMTLEQQVEYIVKRAREKGF